MTKDVQCVILVLSVIILAGCNSHQSNCDHDVYELRHITITTDPADASVYQKRPLTREQVSLGQTPLTAVSAMVLTCDGFTRDSKQLNKAVVWIEKDGFETYKGFLETDPNESLGHHIKLKPLANE